MKTHALDLVTLVKSLSQHSALLTTPILETLPGFVGPCRGWVQVQKGVLVRCVLEGVNGERMEGEQALSLVRSLTEWQVTLDQDLARPVSTASVPSTDQHVPTTPRPDLIPRRQVAALSAALLAPLSRKERMVLRMVFTMVNGQRGIQQIKEDLHVSAESIDHALGTLHHLHAIDYRTPSSV